MSDDIGGIIGGIFAIIVLLSIVPILMASISNIGNDDELKEIESLKLNIANLNAAIQEKEQIISNLRSTIETNSKTIDQKDTLIGNLTYELNQTQQELDNLTQELAYYSEKKYLTEINNNYYELSSYFQHIENQFFPIYLSLSLISLTFAGFIIKIFNVHLLIRKYWKKVFHKETHHTKIEVNK